MTRLRIPLSLIAALATGVAMSWGQTFAPDSWAPLVNSGAPVVSVAAGVAWWGAGPRGRGCGVWLHGVLGALAGPLAVLGYYGTSWLRGFGLSPTMLLFWSSAGVVLGAAMGVAVWVLRQPGRSLTHGAAAAVWPGIAAGEAAHGIVRISDTTPLTYWWSLAAVAAAVLGGLVLRRLRGGLARTVAVVGTCAVGAAIFVVYGLA